MGNEEDCNLILLSENFIFFVLFFEKENFVAFMKRTM